jgi:hypothetical protein
MSDGPSNRRGGDPRWIAYLGAIASVVTIIGFLFSFGVLRFPALSSGSLPISSSSPTSGSIPQTRVIVEDNLTTSHRFWEEDSTCVFKSDGLHVLGRSACAARPNEGDSLTNTVMAVTAQQLDDNLDAYFGLTFRTTTSGSGYRFLLSRNGSWEFVKTSQGSASPIVPTTTSSTIKRGHGSWCDGSSPQLPAGDTSVAGSTPDSQGRTLLMVRCALTQETSRLDGQCRTVAA